MSEFSEEDFKKWLQLSFEKQCNLNDAIYYSLFWSLRNDVSGKYIRAIEAFNEWINEKTGVKGINI